MEGDTGGRCGRFPEFVEVGAFAQGEDPDKGTDDNNTECVDDECVVESDESKGYVASLDEGDDGYTECY